jgi:GNAT superfamily N-acetyltransferase
MIAFDGSIPIAFGAIDYSTTEPDTALIGVWVLPDYRRRGLATRVAEDLIDFAREKGYRRVRGRLPEGNEPALSFLSAIGAMVPLRNPDMTFELPL